MCPTFVGRPIEFQWIFLRLSHRFPTGLASGPHRSCRHPRQWASRIDRLSSVRSDTDGRIGWVALDHVAVMEGVVVSFNGGCVS